MNIDKFISLLNNRNFINEYVKLLKSCVEGVITRDKEIMNTVACRLWQLQYCIFTFIFNENIELLSNPTFLHMLCSSYINFLRNINENSSYSPLLYNFIILNNINNYKNCLYYKNYINIEPNSNYFYYFITQNLNTYLCIYGINKKTNEIETNGVIHYFTIINDNNSNYYITSSWGSDEICVPYQTNKLDNLNEFLHFCTCLYNLKFEKDINSKYIIYFMNKYFFIGAKRKRYSDEWVEEMPELRHKWIEPEEGIKKEADYILKNTIMDFDIAIITDYEIVVKNEIIKKNIKATSYISDDLIESISKKLKQVKINKTLSSSIKKPKH